MIDLFGVAWLSHGTMDVRFVGLTNVEDIVVPKAVVKSKEVHDNQTEYLMEVWVENQRGEKVLVGTATGVATQ
jgi:HD-like signal output (HDOD) protein